MTGASADLAEKLRALARECGEPCQADDVVRNASAYYARRSSAAG